jgi:predicted transcriptional regulator of viral defense system
MAEQSFTPLDTAVIRAARRRRRPVLVLREDGKWLSELTSNPRRLLQRMAKRGALRPVGRGRYAVVDRVGTDSLEETAPWQVLVDGLLAPYGDYYLGYLTGLVEHGLTDLESPTIYSALLGPGRDLKGELSVLNRRVVTTFIVERKWFGVEPVRLSRAERYYRSDLHRTLVDCLDRPQLCGSAELYVSAWARALNEQRVQIPTVCEYARRLGASVAQRAGVLLTVAGYEDEAREQLGVVVGRRPYVVFDRAARFAGQERDATWGVTLNIPRDVLEGWTQGWKS